MACNTVIDHISKQTNKQTAADHLSQQSVHKQTNKHSKMWRLAITNYLLAELLKNTV